MGYNMARNSNEIYKNNGQSVVYFFLVNYLC